MFELRVLNGLHQGAALPLIGEQWLIGSDAEQDLALFDLGIAALHCRLNRSDDGWTLLAEEGPVCDEEGHQHSLTELTPNIPFVLGTVWLCLAPAQEDWTAAPAKPAMENLLNDDPAPSSPPTSPPLEKIISRSRGLNRTSGVIVGLLVGIVGSAWGLSHSTSPGTDNPATAVTTSSQSAASSKIKLATAEDTRRLLNTLLSERMLSGVTVQSTADGLSLTGSVKDESLEVYQRMLQRFKEQYAAPVAVIDNVSNAQTGLPFAIVQIISGPMAHLVTNDGHRLYIGDELDGLKLTKIDEQHIEFEGDHHYEVRW